jgi:Tat protein secretion system quality control protein TatD with DNase activity
VTLVGEAIGNLKGASAEEMASLTWANTDRAYGLGDPGPKD